MNITLKRPLSGLLLWLGSLMLSASGMASAADGSAMIRLYGNSLAPDTPKRLSVNQIESIGIDSVTAYNPFEKASDEYTGVWLDRFVEHFAAGDINRITLKAIDDYEIEFVPSDWQQFRILVATRVNGQYIGYEQKGPMRIIYPDFDPDKEIYQVNLPKWMWMINKIEFN